jgi:hypothetical protein
MATDIVSGDWVGLVWMETYCSTGSLLVVLKIREKPGHREGQRVPWALVEAHRPDEISAGQTRALVWIDIFVREDPRPDAGPFGSCWARTRRDSQTNAPAEPP